jgi:phosphoribosylglycinamide formyltransferase-1
LRIAALISGSGTTLQNLLDRKIGEIVGVVASKPGVAGIDRAKRAKVPCEIVAKTKAMTVEEYSDHVFEAVRIWSPDIVCLCGWLLLLKIPVDFEQRVLNIHPALLPAFGGKGMYGRHVHAAVLAAGAKVSGCTVHFADNSYDTGPILVQKCVPVHEGDTPETLAARVFAAECEAYPEAIRLAASGEFRIEGRRVIRANRAARNGPA